MNIHTRRRFAGFLPLIVSLGLCSLGSGADANSPPVLTAPAEMPVHAGATAIYRIEAEDKDGDAIAFRVTPRDGMDPPSQIRVRTVDAGHGHALGEVTVTADSCDQDGWIYNLEAWDGTGSDRKEVISMVERVPRRVPENPMRTPDPGATRKRDREPPWRDRAPDRATLDGEWEWTGSLESGPHGLPPVHGGASHGWMQGPPGGNPARGSPG